MITSKYTILNFAATSAGAERREWGMIYNKNHQNHPSNPRSLPSTTKFVGTIHMFDRFLLGISCSKVPKNIWEQLHKAANSYFLLISFIMFIGLSVHIWDVSHPTESIQLTISSYHVISPFLVVGFDWNPPSSKETTRLCSMVLFASTPPF